MLRSTLHYFVKDLINKTIFVFRVWWTMKAVTLMKMTTKPARSTKGPGCHSAPFQRQVSTLKTVVATWSHSEEVRERSEHERSIIQTSAVYLWRHVSSCVCWWMLTANDSAKRKSAYFMHRKKADLYTMSHLELLWWVYRKTCDNEKCEYVLVCYSSWGPFR